MEGKVLLQPSKENTTGRGCVLQAIVNWNADRMEQKKKKMYVRVFGEWRSGRCWGEVATVGWEIRQGRHLELVPWNKKKYLPDPGREVGKVLTRWDVKKLFWIFICLLKSKTERNDTQKTDRKRADHRRRRRNIRQRQPRQPAAALCFNFSHRPQTHTQGSAWKRLSQAVCVCGEERKQRRAFVTLLTCLAMPKWHFVAKHSLPVPTRRCLAASASHRHMCYYITRCE